MKEDLFKGLTDEQIAMVKACKDQKELLSLAKKEGIELTDEQLEAVSGGSCSPENVKDKCPECGSEDVTLLAHQYLLCNKCKYRWTPAVTINR